MAADAFDLLKISFPVLIVHLTSLTLSAIVFVFGRRILALFSNAQPPAVQIIALRSCIAVYFIFESVDILLLHATPEYNRPLYRGALTILSLLALFIAINIGGRWSRNKFGRQKTIDGKSELLPSYNSRLATIILSIVTSLISMIAIIKIWEMDSLLQTTGFVGLIAGALVFTNAIWLPDLYYGLIVLGSDMLGDGDAVRLEPDGPIYSINKVSFVYTSLLNIENNNRTIIRNSKLFDGRIENLTKLASVDGLRQTIRFKVGYPNFGGQPDDVKAKELDRFWSKLDKIFASAFENITKDKERTISRNNMVEWGVGDAGDYALEIVLNYYLDPLPPTKIAKKLRKYLFGTRLSIIQAVYRQSVLQGIDLSTPTVIDLKSSRVRLRSGGPPPQPENA